MTAVAMMLIESPEVIVWGMRMDFSLSVSVVDVARGVSRGRLSISLYETCAYE